MTTATIYNCYNNDLGTDFNGSYNLSYIQTPPSNINILTHLSSFLSQSSDPDLNKIALSFLNCFQGILVTINNSDNIPNTLPPLLINTVENETIFIEWIFPDFRIGFSIEKEPQDSNWFIVTNKQFKEQTSSGLFDPYNPQEVLLNLISFALRNS